MARTSGWQQFANNFNSMYGLTKDIRKESALSGIMSDEIVETYDDEGVTTGFHVNDTRYDTKEDADMGRMTHSADALMKLGYNKEAMDLRTKVAGLQGTKNQNLLFKETFEIQKKQSQSDLDASNAKITALQAQIEALSNSNDFTKATQKGEIDKTNTSNEAEVGTNNLKIDENSMLSKYRAQAKIPFGEPGGFANQEERFTSFVGEYAKVHGDEAAGKFAVSYGQNGLALLEQETDKIRLGFDKVLRTGDVNELKTYVDDFNGANNVELQTGKDGSLTLVETTPEGEVVNTTTGKNLKDLQGQLKGRVDEKGAMAAAKSKLDNQLIESTIALNKAKETSGVKFNEKYWAKQRLETHPNDILALKYAGFDVPYDEHVGFNIAKGNNVDIKTLPAKNEPPADDGAADGADNVNNAGLSGVTAPENQILEEDSANERKIKSYKSMTEIQSRMNALRRKLGKDLVPFTLDSNLPASDFKKQKRRDKVLDWLNSEGSEVFIGDPKKLEAFESDPTGWWLKNVKNPETENKGLK